MTQILELPDKKLKLAMINILRNLAEKAETLYKDRMSDVSREREKYSKNKLK